ncbi:MAG: hypothetical protein ACREHD_09670, partial [Pirellulales bacterium]
MRSFEALERRDLLSAMAAHVTPPLVPHHIGGSPVSPAWTSGYQQGLAPSQMRHAYSVDQITFSGNIAGDGTGQTIAIVDPYDDPNVLSDLDVFDHQ